MDFLNYSVPVGTYRGIEVRLHFTLLGEIREISARLQRLDHVQTVVSRQIDIEQHDTRLLRLKGFSGRGDAVGHES